MAKFEGFFDQIWSSTVNISEIVSEYPMLIFPGGESAIPGDPRRGEKPGDPRGSPSTGIPVQALVRRTAEVTLLYVVTQTL